MNSGNTEISRIERLLYEEGNSAKALLHLKSLETDSTLIEETILLAKALKSYALYEHAGVRIFSRIVLSSIST